MTKATQTILVIDDNPADAGVLKRLLAKVEHLQYEFIHELTSQAGKQQLENNSVDCLILDYQLGSANGVEVLRDLRSSGFDVPVIAYTGVGSETVAVEAMKEGAQDYLVKGEVTSASLFRAIDNAIERVKLERRFEERQEELRSFVGMVAHDLRAPIRHIEFLSEVLKEDAPPLGEELDSTINNIHRASRRMANLVEGLLEHTKYGRSSFQLETVDLENVAREVLADLASLIDAAGAEVIVDSLPQVMGDEIGLRQLLQNLITNGIKFNESGAPRIRVSAVDGEDGTCIRVTDNGIGIPAKHQQEIFQPLRRIDGAHSVEGCGLGLATAKKIAKQHRARLWVESELGGGSTFHIAFPGSSITEPDQTISS